MENILEAKAVLRYLRVSARKARLVLDLIRNKSVNDARKLLEFSNKQVAKDIKTLLNSAVANATQVAGKEDSSNMVVDKAFADVAGFQKKHVFKPKGSVHLTRRRSCHITIGVMVRK